MGCRIRCALLSSGQISSVSESQVNLRNRSEIAESSENREKDKMTPERTTSTTPNHKNYKNHTLWGYRLLSAHKQPCTTVSLTYSDYFTIISFYLFMVRWIPLKNIKNFLLNFSFKMSPLASISIGLTLTVEI